MNSQHHGTHSHAVLPQLNVLYPRTVLTASQLHTMSFPNMKRLLANPIPNCQLSAKRHAQTLAKYLRATVAVLEAFKPCHMPVVSHA